MRWTPIVMVAVLSTAAWAEDAEKPKEEAPKAEAPKAEAKKDEAKPAEAPAATAEGGDFSVLDAKVGTGIDNLMPVGESSSFKTDVGKVWFWTKVSGTEGQEITHAWYKGEEKMSEVKLPMKFGTMRTWSYKSIPTDGAGDWRVDVVSPSGTVLKSVAFKVE